MPHQLINGIALYYEVHGSGQPLVLICGLGGDHTFWRASIPRLAAHYQVISYDPRGSGQTQAPDSAYTIETMADDLAALLDALQVAQSHVVGFSMGGLVAQAFAIAYPQRVMKLILAASFAVMNVQARLFLDAVLSVYESGATGQQMVALILPWLFSVRFMADPANAAYLVYDGDDPYPQPLSAWRAQYQAQRQHVIHPGLSTLRAPTLVLAGEQDRLAPLEDAHLLAAHIRYAQVQLLPGSGHLLNYEQPALFHASLLSFLAR